MFEARMYVAGRWQTGASTHIVRNPYTNNEVTRSYFASLEQVDEAVDASVEAFSTYSAWPAHRRARLLREAAQIVATRADEAAKLIQRENAKSVASAKVEVARVIETLEASADEAMRLVGEMLPLDSSPRGEGRVGFTLRVPVGVVAAITPFNSPMNLAAHKIGPALAAGNTIVLKPHPQTPACNVLLVEALISAGMPSGVLNLVLGGGDVGERLVRHERVKIVSFTGGTGNAERVREAAGKKRLLLELGGNNGTIVHSDADVERAVVECVRHSFGYQGQSCIGVQRLFVQESIYSKFIDRFVDATKGLKVGDPADPSTSIGPLINQEAAERVVRWVRDAEAQGASVLAGGDHQGSVVAPTILVDAPESSQIVCEEVFGPVVVVAAYGSLKEAIAHINRSKFGLQAGIFTSSIGVALQAAQSLDVGGVVVNGTSNFRIDIQPYGGVKDSGVGREGPAYAIRDMTDVRSVVVRA